MLKDLVFTVLQSTFVALLRVPFILLGLPLVLLGIPFRVPGVSTKSGREIVNLPRWLWVWGNDHDGLLGDKRGSWDRNAPFGLGAGHWFSMWVWAAWRNPANNLRHVPIFSVAPGDLRDLRLHGDAHASSKLPGWAVWSSWSSEAPWSRRHSLYFRIPYGTTGRSFYAFIGYKCWPKSVGVPGERYGVTFRFNPYKRL